MFKLFRLFYKHWSNIKVILCLILNLKLGNIWLSSLYDLHMIPCKIQNNKNRVKQLFELCKLYQGSFPTPFLRLLKGKEKRSFHLRALYSIYCAISLRWDIIHVLKKTLQPLILSHDLRWAPSALLPRRNIV